MKRDHAEIAANKGIKSTVYLLNLHSTFLNFMWPHLSMSRPQCPPGTDATILTLIKLHHKNKFIHYNHVYIPSFYHMFQKYTLNLIQTLQDLWKIIGIILIHIA